MYDKGAFLLGTQTRSIYFYFYLDILIYISFLAVDSAAFFGYMGVTSALVFANLGASYGCAKSGVGIASLGVIDSSKVIKGLIPVIMAGILSIYGVIVAVLLNSKVKTILTDNTN